MFSLSPLQKLSAAAVFAGAAAVLSQQPVGAIYYRDPACDNDLPYCTNSMCDCEAASYCDHQLACPGTLVCMGVNGPAYCASESGNCEFDVFCQPLT